MDMSFQQLQEKIKFVEDGVDQNIAAIENPIISKFYIEFRNSLFAMYQYLLIFSTGNLNTPLDTSKIDTIEHFVGLGCSLLGAMPIPFIDFIEIALSQATEATTILVKKRLAKKIAKKLKTLYNLFSEQSAQPDATSMEIFAKKLHLEL